MHFQVKMLDNGRNNIFIDKETTKKVEVMFLNVKVLTESQLLHYCTLPPN